MINFKTGSEGLVTTSQIAELVKVINKELQKVTITDTNGIMLEQSSLGVKLRLSATSSDVINNIGIVADSDSDSGTTTTTETSTIDDFYNLQNFKPFISADDGVDTLTIDTTAGSINTDVLIPTSVDLSNGEYFGIITIQFDLNAKMSSFDFSYIPKATISDTVTAGGSVRVLINEIKITYPNLELISLGGSVNAIQNGSEITIIRTITQ